MILDNPKESIRVYIAGPYSKPDQAVNTKTAMEIWHMLADKGYAPFCPHLSHFLHIAKPRDYEEWLAQDLVWLYQCNAVLRFQGESSGADKEVAAAFAAGIPVFFTIQDLHEYFVLAGVAP